MGDPILDAHRRAPMWYAISGPSPISIRDQMLRGVTIAHRLSQAGEIGVDRPLLVLGAGVGGASAAMTAAALGVPTFLVDRANRPFTAQSYADNRELHPTQYDWPAVHFRGGTLKYNGNALPLPYTPKSADLLSIDWQGQLHVAASDPSGSLVTRFGYSLDGLWPHAGPSGVTERLDVGFQHPTNGPLNIRVAAVIQAFGIGSENCRFEHGGRLAYEGQPFWGPDDFAAATNGTHAVLISGSGDGALQDYLRIVTGGKRPIDILTALESRADIPADLLLAIMSAEDEAHRGRSWAHDDDPALRHAHQRPYFAALEKVHRHAVAELLGLASRGALTQRQRDVRAAISALVGSPPQVHVVYRGPFITAYYGLNRFLALLISEHLRVTHGVTSLYPNSVISSIAAASHPSHECVTTNNSSGCLRANGVYRKDILVRHECFGKDHDVQFQPVKDKDDPSVGAPPPDQTYNVIIIRHGIVAPQPLAALEASALQPVPMKRVNHLLPYGQT